MSVDENLTALLKRLRKPRTLILGIGNTLKGDDGLGPVLCSEIKGRISTEVIDTGTVPENYIGPIVKKAPQLLLIVDAIDFGAAPGTVRILTPRDLSILSTSTHTSSPRLFVDTICEEISVEVYFLGIQPAQTELGQPLSPQVAHAVESLAEALTQVFPKTS